MTTEKRTTLTLAVVTRGDRFALVDGSGHAATGWYPLASFPPGWSDDLLARREWVVWSKRAANTLRQSVIRSAKRALPWGRKVETWLKSIRLRAKDRERPRKSVARKARHTWDEAVKLMRYQAHNEARKARLTPWQRWAQTVANNLNKRKGGRYGRA